MYTIVNVRSSYIGCVVLVYIILVVGIGHIT